MKPNKRIITWTALSLAFFAAGCVTHLPLEGYTPLGAKTLPKAKEVTICVQPFEDETKNGFSNKKWVGIRYNALGVWNNDYELREGSISGVVTQAAAAELTAQGFQVVNEAAPKKFTLFGETGGVNEDCDYIVKGRIKKFWCKVFFDITTEVAVEAELMDANTGKTLWLKKEQKNSFQEPNELLMTKEQEPQWIAENLRSSRDYLIRKLFRDERFLYILTRKLPPADSAPKSP